MLTNQRTLAKSAKLTGVGLHTGNKVTVTFKPAEANTGVRFVRTDVDERIEIPADIDHVVENSRDTTLGIGDVHVRQVEHTLAALYGLQIDNAIVEVDSNELPVTDGSARPIVDILIEAGFEEQDSPRDVLDIEETLTYSDQDKGIDLVVLPSDELRITFMVDYQNPALGTQYSSMYSLDDEFVEEFSSARTFCFLSEVEALHDQGLIQGGSLDNAIVIIDHELTEAQMKRLTERFNLTEKVPPMKDGILGNRALRYYNEPVRHKVLDLIGDLALLGVPLKAHVMAARSGHAAHVELVKKIRQVYKKKQVRMKFQRTPTKKGVLFNSEAIQNIIPHRYPFLMVDRIVQLEPPKRVVGIKNLSVNEHFFQGHFPGNPVMPGVLIIEAMAQTGAVLLSDVIDNPEDKIAYFMKIDNVRFRKPVVPGDQLYLDVELTKLRPPVNPSSYKMAGKAYVHDELVAEGEFMGAILDHPDLAKKKKNKK